MAQMNGGSFQKVVQRGVSSRRQESEEAAKPSALMNLGLFQSPDFRRDLCFPRLSGRESEVLGWIDLSGVIVHSIKHLDCPQLLIQSRQCLLPLQQNRPTKLLVC